MDIKHIFSSTLSKCRVNAMKKERNENNWTTYKAIPSFCTSLTEKPYGRTAYVGHKKVLLTCLLFVQDPINIPSLLDTNFVRNICVLETVTHG